MRPTTSSTGTIRSMLLAPEVILTVVCGRVPRSEPHTQLVAFTDALMRTSAPVWLMDATKVTGFDPDVIGGAIKWFDAFRGRKGHELVFVSQNSAATMACRALGFSTGLRVRVVETRRAALELLDIADATATI